MTQSDQRMQLLELMKSGLDKLPIDIVDAILRYADGEPSLIDFVVKSFIDGHERGCREADEIQAAGILKVCGDFGFIEGDPMSAEDAARVQQVLVDARVRKAEDSP